MKRFFLTLALLVTLAFNAIAANVKLVASAPSVVEAGDQFRIQYTVNTSDATDFEQPLFKGFELIFGPSTSTQSSFQIVNGKSSHSSSVTYTFILLASKEGSFTVPPATIKVDGKTVRSNSVTIKVNPMGQGRAHSQGGGHSGQTAPIQSRQQTGLAKGDLFMTATANRTNVYEQEAILLTYKLYTLVNLTQLDGKLPQLNGFQIQELPLPRTKQFSVESYNGKTYRTVVWSQYVLFPQQTGKLVIPSITFEGVVEELNRSIDPVDAFFNGTSGIVELKKKISTPQLVINVSPLPAKPDKFSGAVGSFSIKSSINSKEFKTNDAINIKVDLTGTGNMKLIATPEVDFPKDFEVYDPKVNDSFKLGNGGLTGTRQFEYLAVPRNPGKFTIPAVNFVFFDVNSHSYKTISTEPYVINVTKGAGNSSQAVSDFTGGQAVKTLNQDIRYIKLGNADVRKKGYYFFATWKYWMCYIVMFVLAIVALVVGSKRARQNADVAFVKGKRANKVAQKRMKVAAKLMQEGKNSDFYDEVMRTLWGYVSDKLNIPTEKLNKDNVASQLADKGVEQQLVDSFLEALNQCEFARYAPGDPGENMDKVYNLSVDVISQMENFIKK